MTGNHDSKSFVETISLLALKADIPLDDAPNELLLNPSDATFCSTCALHVASIFWTIPMKMILWMNFRLEPLAVAMFIKNVLFHFSLFRKWNAGHFPYYKLLWSTSRYVVLYTQITVLFFNPLFSHRLCLVFNLALIISFIFSYDNLCILFFN